MTMMIHLTLAKNRTSNIKQFHHCMEMWTVSIQATPHSPH